MSEVLETPTGIYKKIASTSSTATADKTPKNITVKEGLTVYLGGAGMAGGYIEDQVKSLRKVGISGAVVGRNTAGQYVDAVAGVNKHRYRLKKINGMSDTGPYSVEADWSLESLGVNKPIPAGGQFNLIGYSFGSLVAAQSALYYADKGQPVDYLVLIGSPISEEMLMEAKQNALIKHVVVLDLKAHGDPIHAGMSFVDLAVNAPLLGWQMTESASNGEGMGHFYYGIDGASGEQRRLELAKSLYAEGLR
ncbi:alpha/beta hydrolase [Pseudomonas cichorii]|nr:alpha/beta hydrolase [Pseudomonas cichorii]MBX8600677.1 alpha/beta hydrolase [Pseudomonas cichorii]